jgi:hypothetical protein
VNATLTVHPDGRVTGLYTEVIDLHRLGRLHVERYTSIEFSDEHQQWCVNDSQGRTLYSHPTRQQCLAWEQEYFNKQEQKKTEHEMP